MTRLARCGEVGAMISKSEIETYAARMAEPDFEISPPLGHLDERDLYELMNRSEQIARKRLQAVRANVVKLTTLLDLAHATGMPDDGKPIAWLRARGIMIGAKQQSPQEGSGLRKILDDGHD
jgi:hypothetical protein